MIGNRQLSAAQWERWSQPSSASCLTIIPCWAGSAVRFFTVALLWLGKLFSRPRLPLLFDGADDGYLSESTHYENKHLVTRKYLRGSLTNRGLSNAQDCRIYVASIQPITNGSVVKDRIHDARHISWPPNNTFEARDIPRGVASSPTS